MRRLFFLSSIFFLFITCNEKGKVKSTDFFSFKLPDSENSEYDFSLLKKNKASVFVFLAPDCPLSQNYTLTLNNLHETFKKNDIGFYGIVSGNNFKKKEVDDFDNTYQVNFPILLDTDFNLMAYFKATKTPEVFVINSAEKILYQGAIDNWSSDLGVHRSVISKHYLEDALNDIIKNSEVRIKKTKVVGCFIERNL